MPPYGANDEEPFRAPYTTDGAAKEPRESIYAGLSYDQMAGYPSIIKGKSGFA